MRVAFISDLHGNDLALRAVLAELTQLGVDRIICLGDVATLGFRPEETLALLEQSRALTIMGNHDEFMLDASLVGAYTTIPVLIDAIDWCRERLSGDALSFIRGFQRSFSLTLENGAQLLAYHGTPESNVTDLLATTPPEQVEEMLRGHSAAIMIGGHTHLQMLRQHRGILLVNPGSLGMPFAEYAAGGPPEVLPHAEYAVVDSRRTGTHVSLRRVYLDKQELRDAALSVDNPLCASLARMYG